MRSVILSGIILGVLAGLAPAAQKPLDPSAIVPLGPKVEPAPFQPAPIKQPLRPTLKVSPATGADVVLVQDGRPTCVLMVADKPTGAAAQGAAALQGGLKKMTGAAVAIAKESELTLAPQAGCWTISHKGQAVEYLVAVGDTTLSAAQGLAGKDLPLEGYRIKTVGNVLFLAGSDVRPDNKAPLEGSRHAAVALLERRLGFRWLWPGDLGEVVPHQATVKIAAMDEQDAPAVRQRTLRNYAYGHVQKVAVPADPTQPGSKPTQKLVLEHDRVGAGMKVLGLTSDDYVGWCGQSTAWWMHQRLGGSFAMSAGHSYGGWWDRYGAQHPEWFALQGSGSRTPGHLPAQREQLCFSNPGLIEQVVQTRIGELKSNPGRDGVSVSPNDGGGGNSPCLCEACRRLDPVNGAPMTMTVYIEGKKTPVPYVVLSDRIFSYYNHVAEGVAKVLPDRLLGTYAYGSYRDLPLGVRPHPNLLVGFVGMGYWDDDQLEGDRHRWEQWAGVARNLFLRPNAFHAGHGMPGVFVKKLDHDIKRCYQTGMIAADFDSIIHNWAAQGLNYYVLAKLLWDPSQDAEALVQDYCQKGFGPAAGIVRRYFSELEDVANRCAASDAAGAKAAAPAGELRQDEMDEAGVKHGEAFVRLARAYTPAVFAKLHQTLAEARAAAGNDEQAKQRIAFLEAGLRYGELTAPVMREFFAKPADKAPLQRLLTERQAAFRDLVRTQPWAVNVAYLAWREGGMWKRYGWNGQAAAAATKAAKE